MAWAAIVFVTAVWLSWDPTRSEDLRRVAVWVRGWVGGAHLYGAGSDVDYPPWAIVVLAPQAAVPTAWLVHAPCGRPTATC